MEKYLINLQKFLPQTNDNYEGVYICNCGQWYDFISINLYINKCDICDKKLNICSIKDNYRVFKDKKQLNNFLNLNNNGSKYNDKYITLDEFKDKVNELSNKEYNGIKSLTIYYYNTIDKKIRNLHQISYRLLSWIFYSCLYFCKLLGYINEDNIQKIIPKNSNSLFNIIYITYKHLENELKQKGINEIQIYLNIIFPKISKIIKQYLTKNTKEIRNNFEKEINEIVESCIREYNMYKKIYLEWNNQLNQMNIYSLKCIIQELYDPQIYHNDKFPFFRFFIIPKYHNKEYLIEQFNLIYQNKQKYPILQNYLNDKGEIKALNNIIKINPFMNSILKFKDKIKTKDNCNRLNSLLFKLFKDFQKRID